MRIKDVEQFIGIKSKNIRFYEKEGLLSPQRNSENGYREYSEDDIKLLQEIKLFRKLGISIEDIRALLASEIELKEVLKQQTSVYDNEINSLLESKALCQNMIARDVQLNKIDTDGWLSQIEALEQRGVRFMNINSDEIIRFLPEKFKMPYYEAIIKDGQVDGELLEDIIKYIEDIYRRKVDAEELLVDILKKTDTNEREKLLSIMKESNKELFSKMSKSIYDFEDIVNIDEEIIKGAFNQFNAQTIVKASLGASPMVNDFLRRIFPSISFEKERTLISDGPIPLSEVVSAQETLVNAINMNMD